MVERLALRRRFGRVDPVFHAGGTTLHALCLSRGWDRLDDADRQAHLAGRADAAHERDARCTADLEEGGQPSSRNAPPRDLLPELARLETTPAATTGPA